MKKIIKEMEALTERMKNIDVGGDVCEWREDKVFSEVYHSICGESMVLEHPNDINNFNFKFCPYCGKPLKWNDQ